MADLTLAVREAVVSKMIASAPLTALVPTDSIYGERVPDDRTYPFIRTGEQTKIAFSLGCGAEDGAYELTIHGFVTGTDSDGAARVGAAIRATFETGSLSHSGTKLGIIWRSGGLIRDPDEPDTWHAYEDFTVV